MADYGISAVRYDSARAYIAKVRVHPYSVGQVGVGTEWARSDVVAAIERGKSFQTILGGGSSWRKGQDVQIIVVNGVKYLRTDKNSTPRDNLENLPEL